jgi:probable rRNA maturation factor
VTRPHRPLGVANRHPRLSVARGALEGALRVLDENGARFRGGCPPGELSVALLTDRALARLHGRFLGEPGATDVITFGGDPAAATAGEICVSVDAALRQGRGRSGLSGELTLYIVHGWLHLAGYDDTTAPARRAMRRAEARAMRLLRGRGALPRFKLA